MVKFGCAALIGLWLASPAVAAAQHEPSHPDSSTAATLAPITVVGARVPSVAPPVETIEVTAERLRRTPASDPYDLVRRSAGIEVHEQGQGPGFASDAVIRGFTSDHSSDLLLVVDGVPINLPLHGHVEGYADWSMLTPASLASLRVIHGPSSPLYGDFAFGGVVEAITGRRRAGEHLGAARLELRRRRRLGPRRTARASNGAGCSPRGRRAAAGLARQLRLLARQRGRPRLAAGRRGPPDRRGHALRLELEFARLRLGRALQRGRPRGRHRSDRRRLRRPADSARALPRSRGRVHDARVGGVDARASAPTCSSTSRTTAWSPRSEEEDRRERGRWPRRG